MTFEEFQATAHNMTAAEYEAEYGEGTVADLLEPDETIRVYQHGTWIVNKTDGSHYLLLETDEWQTKPEGPTLADLERHLWDWMQPINDCDHN